MSETKLKELRSDIDELNELIKQAKRKKVQDILSLEARKLETEWSNLKEAITKSTNVEALPVASSAAAPKRYQIKLNGYGWDQSDKYIKVFVTLKDVQSLPKEQVFCTLTEKSMELHVQNLDNKDYILVINKLLEPINVGESHWKQKTDMVVIFLAKMRPGVKWSHMTEVEKKFEDQRNSRFKPAEDTMDKNKDPQESIMSLMKNISCRRSVDGATRVRGRDSADASSVPPQAIAVFPRHQSQGIWSRPARSRPVRSATARGL